MEREIQQVIPSKDILRKLLLKKIESNSSYSARAFARDLGVSAAFITLVFSGKKKLNVDRAISIAKNLKLNESDKQSLMESVLSERGMDLKVREEIDYDNLSLLLKEQFSVVADWYHLAILDLTTVNGFQPKVPWIAKRLGLSSFEVKTALDRLVNVGLLISEDGTYRKSHSQLRFPTKNSLNAVREHHRQMMERAKLQLEKTDQESFQERMICSLTCAADPERIAEARQKVLDFQQELANFLSVSDGCKEVYQLNIQLFPHTNKMDQTL